MNRGYSVEQYFELLDRARAMLPDVQIASDLICGFPTETDEDHAATCSLLRRAGSRIVSFSSILLDQGRRQSIVGKTMCLIMSNVIAIMSCFRSRVVSAPGSRDIVGKTLPVLVESISHKAAKAVDVGGGATATLGWEKPTTQLSGRTEGDLIVVFDADPALVGSIQSVRIERSAPLTLFGSLVGQATRW